MVWSLLDAVSPSPDRTTVPTTPPLIRRLGTATQGSSPDTPTLRGPSHYTPPESDTEVSLLPSCQPSSRRRAGVNRNRRAPVIHMQMATFYVYGARRRGNRDGAL